MLLGLTAFALGAREVGKTPVARGTLLIRKTGVEAGALGRRVADTARFGDCADADERQDNLNDFE